MKRREFLKTSSAAALIAAIPLPSGSTAEPKADPVRELYELRLYHLRRGPMQKRFDDFYRVAAIPALNRAGISPVGVFNVLVGPDSPVMYVLLPHKSAESVVRANEHVHADAEFLQAGAEFLNAPAINPSYNRVESSLLAAFEGFPGIEMPAGTAPKNQRIFELRTYESHSRKASQKKIQMFNQGEIAIFRRVGLTPVFFGETIVGPRMPNLTYLLGFEDMADREKKWSAFGADPEWQKLRSMPGYADTDIVSNISNLFLRATSYSQI
jgi:hypothetical protein